MNTIMSNIITTIELDGEDITDYGFWGIVNKRLNTVDVCTITTTLYDYKANLGKFKPDCDLAIYTCESGLPNHPVFKGYIPDTGISYTDGTLTIKAYGYLAKLNDEVVYIGDKEDADGNVDFISYQGWEVAALIKDLIDNIEGTPLETKFVATDPFVWITPDIEANLPQGYSTKMQLIRALLALLSDESSLPNYTTLYYLRESSGIARLDKTPSLDDGDEYGTLTYNQHFHIDNFQYVHGFGSKAVGNFSDGRFIEFQDTSYVNAYGSKTNIVSEPDSGQVDDFLLLCQKQVLQQSFGLFPEFPIMFPFGFCTQPTYSLKLDADAIAASGIYMVSGVDVPINNGINARVLLGKRSFNLTEVL